MPVHNYIWIAVNCGLFTKTDVNKLNACETKRYKKFSEDNKKDL